MDGLSAVCSEAQGIFLRGIPAITTREELKAKFEGYGTVVGVTIVPSRTHETYTAYVDFDSEAAAQKVLTEFPAGIYLKVGNINVAVLPKVPKTQRQRQRVTDRLKLGKAKAAAAASTAPPAAATVESVASSAAAARAAVPAAAASNASNHAVPAAAVAGLHGAGSYGSSSGDRGQAAGSGEQQQQQRGYGGGDFDTGSEAQGIFLRGIPATTTREELKAKFEGYGTVVGVTIVPSRTHETCTAYVDFDSEAAAQKVLTEFPAGTYLKLGNINVAVLPKVPKKQRQQLADQTKRPKKPTGAKFTASGGSAAKKSAPAAHTWPAAPW